MHGQGGFALLPRRQVKHQASGRGMRIQLAVRPDDAALGCGQLLAAVDHRANGAQRSGFVRGRPNDVDAQLGRGVAPARRHQRMHRAAHRRIEQRGIPAAMHRAQRVVVLELRRALESRLAGLDGDQREVQRLGYVRSKAVRLPASPA